MALTTYPTTPMWSFGFDAPIEFDVEIYNAGVNEQRNLHFNTNGRQRFEIPYENLSYTEMKIIRDYFVARKGMLEPFNFTYTELDGTTVGPIVCRFDQKSFPRPSNGPMGFSFTIKLKEVFNES